MSLPAPVVGARLSNLFVIHSGLHSIVWKLFPISPILTFILHVTVACKCICALPLAFRTQQDGEADGEEGDHSTDHKDDEAQRELFPPGLLHLLVGHAAHFQERWQGPAGGDSREDDPAGRGLVLLALLEHGLGRLKPIWARERFAAAEGAVPADGAAASIALEAATLAVHGSVADPTWSPRHGAIDMGCCRRNIVFTR